MYDTHYRFKKGGKMLMPDDLMMRKKKTSLEQAD